MKIFLLAIAFGFLFLGISEAKDFDISITGSIGYNRASWGSGEGIQPGGTLHKSAIVYNPSFQIKYTGLIIQPTIEGNYRWTNYNFSTYQAPIQKMEPRAWSILLGGTYDFKPFSVYALAGITRYDARVSLIEHPDYKLYPKYYFKTDPKTLVHGTRLGFYSYLFTYKIGAYKLWKLGPIKLGPEISLQGWNKQPGWSKCREGRENIIQPNVGIRVQY